MAYVNGFFEVGSAKTLTDFFVSLKNSILEHTDWKLIESESTSIKLVFNTKIDDITCTITDRQITSESSTTTSNNLLFAYSRNGKSVNNIVASYSQSTYSLSQNADRCIKIMVHNNDNIKLVSFINFNFNTATWSNNSLGKFKTTNIASGEVIDRYAIGTTLYRSDTNSSLVVYAYITTSCTGGIVMMNLVNSNTITDYVNNCYNCSTVISGSYYQINGKKYFALTTNILVEE